MFDIGWPEMLVVAVVAIIVVGPKDLPGMLRSFGRTVKKLRAMAGDFQRQFDDALKDAELDGLKDTVDQVRTLDPTRSLKDGLNPLKSDLLNEKKAEPASNDYDPEELFDEEKAPSAPEPVKVDVDAALEKQKAKSAPKKKAARKPATSKSKTGAKSKTAAKSNTSAQSKSAPKPSAATKAKAPAKPKAAAKPRTAAKHKPAAKTVKSATSRSAASQKSATRPKTAVKKKPITKARRRPSTAKSGTTDA